MESYSTEFRQGLIKTAVSYLLIFHGFLPIICQNVGIGTNNPTEKLTVDGTIRVENNSSANAPHLQLHETEFDYARLKFSNSTTSSYFSLAGRPAVDSSIAKFNLFNSDFGNIFTATAAGRFGINKVSPEASFHVDAVSGFDPIRIQNANATKFRIFSNNAIVLGSNWQTPIANVIRVATPSMFIGFDGDHVPEERLEVDGDVMITGGIKANTVNGTPGQILTTGNDGNIAWSSPCQYNRFNGFPVAGTIPWTVPVGVTEIMVEIWGAGGGGAFGGGGGAGGYVKAIFAVNPGETLTIVTGSGGNGTSGGMSSTSTDGGASSITGTNVSAAALGGISGTNTSAGNGGAFSVTPPYLSATALKGGNGNLNVSLPLFSGTTKLTHGNGGQSPISAKNYGRGEFVIITGTTMNYNPGSSGAAFGGGGGGGSQFGNTGGDGYVIIRWN